MQESLVELSKRILDNYLDLKVLQPGHKLLEYGVPENGKLNINSDRKIRSEFFREFVRPSKDGYKGFGECRSAIVIGMLKYSRALDEAVIDFIYKGRDLDPEC